jgi:hypothetical protein
MVEVLIMTPVLGQARDPTLETFFSIIVPKTVLCHYCKLVFGSYQQVIIE